MHNKIFNRKTIIIASIIAVVLVVGLVLWNSLGDYLGDAIKEAVKPDESKLSQTHNASRYFFRVGYPEDWYVEEDASGFGFQNDSERGIVIKMFNSADTNKAVTESSAPSATAPTIENGMAKENDYSTVINFFYRGIRNGEEITALDACKKYMDEFASGLMYGDEYVAEYSFSGISDFMADNLTFSRVSYACNVYACEKGANGEKVKTGEPVETLRGELYTASRRAAYYAINFETSLETSSKEYNEYRKDFINILNDFRFSVFDD
ncbi:MAG: hypothetical protein E7384_02505 [Ruminococcaceae bacterium]|nr:hypothetical protein [Oscillospiraceae bacterium]